MAELEDIRGRSFRWRYLHGFPLEVEIREDDRSVGRLHKPTNLRPLALVQLAGIDWEIRWGENSTLPSYKIGFANTSIVHGTAAFSGGIFGEYKMSLDGLRSYRHKALSEQTAIWEHEKKTTVEFTRYGSSVQPKEGSIIVERRTELLDAPPLLSMGLLLILEGAFFPASG